VENTGIGSANFRLPVYGESAVGDLDGGRLVECRLLIVNGRMFDERHVEPIWP